MPSLNAPQSSPTPSQHHSLHHPSVIPKGFQLHPHYPHSSTLLFPTPPSSPRAPLSLLPTPSAATTSINIQKAAFPGQAPSLGWGAPGGNVNNGAARDSPLAAGRGDPAAHLPRQISCRSSLWPNFVPRFPPSPLPQSLCAVQRELGKNGRDKKAANPM